METTLDSIQVDARTIEYAGFWIRFVAYIIDSIVVWVINAVVTMMFFSSFMLTPEDMSAGNISSLFFYFIIVLVLDWGYFAYMESSKNQGTLGKMALNLRVTDMAGERISFLNATGRYFAKIISVIVLCIGFIMVAFTEKKQGLHDIIAGTLVVKN